MLLHHEADLIVCPDSVATYLLPTLKLQRQKSFNVSVYTRKLLEDGGWVGRQEKGEEKASTVNLCKTPPSNHSPTDQNVCCVAIKPLVIGYYF